MASLADIRARLAAQDNKSNKTYTPGESAVYPHWSIEEGSTAIIRFLEDADASNPYFWTERQVFKFPFNGIKANAALGIEGSSKETIVQIPCMEMYDEKDTVLDEVRTWFKDPTMEDMGRKYWKKRSYLFQGFVRSDPMEDGTKPENPIRRFVISPQIFTLIKNSLMDPDIENLPTDALGGLDFRINKTKKGEYSDYSTSSWARKETALTEEEGEAIEKHGLFNLSDFLPAKPSEEAQKVIMEMFEASIDGEAYDAERWGAYYTPYGVSKTDTKARDIPFATKAPVETAIAAPATSDIPAPVAVAGGAESMEAAVETAEAAIIEEPVAEAAVVKDEASATSGDKAQDILAMIRSRQK